MKCKVFLLFLSQSIALALDLTGPGLRPDRVISPCRHFVINATKAEDVSFTAYARVEGEEYKTPSELYHTDQNGLYLARYSPRATADSLRLAIEVDGQNEDVIIERRVETHGCRCPREDVQSWLHDMAGHADDDEPPRLAHDLDRFADASVDMDQALEDVKENFGAHPGSHSICHYVVYDSRIFRSCYGQHVGFKMFPDATLAALLRQVHLPDLEFFINMGDWPIVRKNSKTSGIPMISWCSNDDMEDMLLPTYELTEATVECMGGQVVDLLSAWGKAHKPWAARKEVAFFRGRDSNAARLKLARMSKERPDLIDAAITNYFFFKDQKEELGSVPHVPLFDFFKNKYVLNVDGTVAAYRLPFLLAGGSLVLKQESEYFEHYHDLMKPWTHYVPVAKDLSDLEERILWARRNDQKAREIAEAGRALALRLLTPEAVLRYHVKLFVGWSRKLAKPVRPREGMEEVRVDDLSGHACRCRGPARDEL